MINLNRNSPSPAYLNSQEAQEYISALINHLNDTNVPKIISKPDKPVSYRQSDLLNAFDNDFYGKCYLTERWFVNSYPMDVEHFIPQMEDPTLVYSWSNLFPADDTANQMKPRSSPVGGYLNPCDPAHNIENEIVSTLDAMGRDPRFSPAYQENILAINTCNLLNRLHHVHDAYTKFLTADLRHAIEKKIYDILTKIIEWRSHSAGQLKSQAERELKELLSGRTSYTMVCRAVPAVVQFVPPDFFD